ncbi:secretory lipase [Xylariaceae sp. FL0255]|nr:secretory lipase [Xylariaceae sp. FL0255]
MRGKLNSALTVLCLVSGQALAQQAWPAAEVQNNTFNGTYESLNNVHARQILERAGVPDDQLEAVLIALDFERSNWAGSSTQIDPFYQDVPSHAGLAGGVPLKIEAVSNASLYTLPPGVSLSRILFTTETLNGTVIPASAFVLWPYLPRGFDTLTPCSDETSKPQPVIGWGHGTSGWSGECGPSHIRNLWYQFSAPFTMALQGYVVVAPDYAGLGLDHDSDGSFIPHQFGANPASGGDLIFAIEAAQKAWSSRLSREFVITGHSQGGGAAWGAAERLAKKPVDGYLGTVAGSPLTSLLDNANFAEEYAPTVLGEGLARFSTAISSVFPSFKNSDWLTEMGVKLINANQELQGCQSVALELVAGYNLSRSDWNQTWYLGAYDALTRSGGKKFAGPMLVLQGTADPDVPETLTIASVNATCEAVPESQLEFAMFDGVGHVPVLYAGQQVWLDWIADRFKGVKVSKGCKQTLYSPQLNVSDFQGDFAYTLQYAEYPYETA